MQRGPLFLAAAFFEVLRFLALMFFVESVGLGDGSAVATAVLRYCAVPQLIFIALFFFLWFDEVRYALYRPLDTRMSMDGLVVMWKALLRS